MLNKAVINLNNLTHNASLIKSRLPVGVKLCAVVKADAYGHGAVACANAVYKIADCFAVALVEEGVELRVSGIDKDILVLISPFYRDIERALTYNLTLTVESLLQIKQVVSVAKRLGIVAKVHVKVNTGMNRQGAELSQLIQMVEYSVANADYLRVEGVYSHFSCPESNLLRNGTLDKFLLAIKAVKGYNKNVVCHISASGGFLKGDYFDMVRIGIMLYGYKPFQDDGLPLKRVMTVYAPVLNVRTLNRGDYLGYGRFKVKEKSLVKLVRYGYADGLPRQTVKGQLNNRCMDLTAMDGKDFVEGRGMFVAVMDDADKLAKKYDTISYEILTKAAIRAEKIYVK